MFRNEKLTTYIINCWFSPTYENPLGDFLFRFFLLNLVQNNATNHIQNVASNGGISSEIPN